MNEFSMSDLVASFMSLFSFLTSQLTNIANFFTQSLLGQVILGIAIFGVAFNVVVAIINKVHK